MPLSTKRLEGWSSAPVPHAKKEYPQPDDPHAPRNYWCAAFVAPRGVGKTQSLARLIHTLEQRGMANASGPVNRWPVLMTSCWMAQLLSSIRKLQTWPVIPSVAWR